MCPFTHVGESRSWKSRGTEHKPGTSENVGLTVIQHAETTGFNIHPNYVNILETNNKWINTNGSMYSCMYQDTCIFYYINCGCLLGFWPQRKAVSQHAWNYYNLYVFLISPITCWHVTCFISCHFFQLNEWQYICYSQSWVGLLSKLFWCGCKQYSCKQ